MRLMTMTAAALLGAAAFAAAARAQGAPGAEADYIRYQKEQDQKGPDPRLETEHYTRLLGLTPDQQKKVQEVFVKQRAIFEKSYAERMRFSKEVSALHERILKLNKQFYVEGQAIEKARAKVRDRVRSLLTPSQQVKYDQIELERERQEREWKERKEAEAHRRLGGDGKQGMFGDEGEGAPQGGGAQPPK
ncbi:MAG: hypothetical protein KGL53_11465 [Elusimicrobia bacterium]|nr:hypothetical protein [Elusimicrobiota bacterium]